MITKEEYKKAIKIVKQYELEQSENKILMKKFRLGDYVKTNKGCRFSSIFYGHVVGFTNWKDYPAVKVKKESSEFTGKRIVTCLAKNLIKVK
jgi:hypothetical protein